MQSLGAGELADAEVRKSERQVGTHIWRLILILDIWITQYDVCGANLTRSGTVCCLLLDMPAIMT